MPSFKLTMPKLSPTMESGTLTTWHKKVGDKVDADELLFEVSTDKATVEYNALDEGYLRAIIVNEGQEAAVNELVAIFTETADEPFEQSGQQSGGAVPPQTPQNDKKPEKNPEDVKSEDKAAQTKTDKSESESRIKASPLAKKLASQEGLELSDVKGTGPGGRIVSRDLESVRKISDTPKEKISSPAPKKEAPAVSMTGEDWEENLSPIKKIVANRLQEAKATIPHFYIVQEVDAEPLVEFREQLSHFEHKVSFNDLMIKAVAIALKEQPNLNTGFNPKNQTIIRFGAIDVSVAVQAPSGLITPIIKKADQKSIEEISLEMRSLIKKAKEGKLHPSEFQGGSFTISNLGMFGVSSFGAIINPPQAGILAVGGILDKPVIKHGKVCTGKTITVTLSVDHRVVDGVAAAEFIKALQKILENPAILNI